MAKLHEDGIMSIFEAMMLICFGAAWPVNIIKSWRTRSAFGKSPGFLIIVIAGYVSGIIHKIIYSPDLVLILYIMNLLMVSLDLLIFFLNRALDRRAAGW